MEGTKERISELEDRKIEIFQSEQQRQQSEHNDQNIRDLGNIHKRATICVTGLLEFKEKEDRTEKVFKELVAENFASLARDKLYSRDQDNPKQDKCKERPIIVKFLKTIDTGKVLKLFRDTTNIDNSQNKVSNL